MRTSQLLFVLAEIFAALGSSFATRGADTNITEWICRALQICGDVQRKISKECSPCTQRWLHRITFHTVVASIHSINVILRGEQRAARGTCRQRPFNLPWHNHENSYTRLLVHECDREIQSRSIGTAESV